jgi:hypothetical protein
VARKTQTPPEDTRPAWLQLLDLETTRQDYQPARRTTGRPSGRPRNPFPRKAVNITLTDDELKMVDGLVEKLGDNIQGIKRGTLIGFMAYLLNEQLKEKDLSQVKLFSDLAALLDQHPQPKPRARRLKAPEPDVQQQTQSQNDV